MEDKTGGQDSIHTIPLNLEMAGGWGGGGGRGGEQTFTQGPHHSVLVSNPLLLRFVNSFLEGSVRLFCIWGKGVFISSV